MCERKKHSAYIYLEDSEQRNGKGVEVGRWRAALKVELTAKQLHTEQRKYENKEEEQEQKGDNAAHRVEQRYNEIPQARPVLGYFEYPEQSQRAKDGQTERAGLERCPDYLENRADNHHAVESVEARLEVLARPERVHLDEHLKHEKPEKHKLGVICGKKNERYIGIIIFLCIFLFINYYFSIRYILTKKIREPLWLIVVLHCHANGV